MVEVLEGAIVLEREGRHPVEVGTGRALMELRDTARRGVNARATELAMRTRCDGATPRLPCDVNR
jgi:hypothetical protein